MGRNTQLSLEDDKGLQIAIYKVPYGSKLFFKNGEKIKKNSKICEWDPYTTPVIAEKSGIANFVDLIDGVSLSETVDDATGIASKSVIDWRSAPENLKKADLIINATSMGMIGQPEFSQPISRAKKTALVIDIVYNPLITELLKEAKKLKLKTVGGIGMLINQAVPGFEHWFQKTPVIDNDIRKFIVE